MKPIKCDCRNCNRSGPVINYMCFCSEFNIYRSVGIRTCLFYQEKMNEEPHGLCSISEILEYMFPEILKDNKDNR